MLWGIGEYWDTGHFQNNGAAGGLDLRHLEKKISGLESAKSTVYSHSYGLHNIFFRFQPEL